jgi:hypothetical protein
MSVPDIEGIRCCFEGMVPAYLATRDGAGQPNLSMISQVHYVDHDQIALSYQFFNKTRRNLLETGVASVLVTDPVSVAQYCLDLDYLETQDSGPLFETMKAKLAGIASHAGMQDVFRLRGADLFRVRAVGCVPGAAQAAVVPPRNLLSAVRRFVTDMGEAASLGELFDVTLAGMRRYLDVEHAMLLLADDTSTDLFTVASTGYVRSGIGSEIPLGQGVIGVAARERVPIRIGNMTLDYSLGRVLRASAQEARAGGLDLPQIPYPGLDTPESQIAVPILKDGRTLGVIFAESMEPLRFRYDDEDALVLIADRLGENIRRLRERGVDPGQAVPVPGTGQRRAIVVRHFSRDDSVFLDNDYLIKGVAGAIFWKLAREHVATGRTEFTNRELRLDPGLRLPTHAENLEARLVLLQRRLAERDLGIGLERTGRGQFRLVAPAPFELMEMDAGAAA